MDATRTPGMMDDNFDMPVHDEQPVKIRKLSHKGKLLIDKETSISKKDFKSQQNDTGDIVRTNKSAPKRKQDLVNLSFSQMMNFPNLESLPKGFVDIYEKKSIRTDLGYIEKVKDTERKGSAIKTPTPFNEDLGGDHYQGDQGGDDYQPIIEETPQKGMDITPQKLASSTKKSEKKEEKNTKNKERINKRRKRN